MPEKIDQKIAVARIESVLGVEYEVIGSYINNKSRITLKHNVCGKEYSPTYKDVVAGKSRCVHCYNPKSILISHEEWLKEVATLVGKEYSVLGESVFFNIEESSETIEKEKVYVSGSGVGDFCKRSYYTRANKDYFTE